MKTKKSVEKINAWWCLDCNPNKEMTHPEMIQHLKDVHGLDTKGLKAKKNMILHLDAADSFQSQYEVTIMPEGGKEIKMHNSVVMPRRR